MIYPYAVKHNGVNYPAGTEVPVGVAPIKEEEKPAVKERDETEQKPKVFSKKKSSK